MAWKVRWAVFIDDGDRSKSFRPYLMEIEATDGEGESGDSCRLTLDDASGQIKLPPSKARIRIMLEGVQVFEGTVDKVRSQGARGSGRTLTVTAKGFDTKGKAKELQAFHKDEATLSEFLEEAADNAGFKIKVDPKFAQIRRDYWSVDDESFLALGQRIAREVHGTFKLRGNNAVLATRDRIDLPTVEGLVGVPGANVIRWDIEPFSGRPRARKTRASWFDRETAEFKSTELELDYEETDAVDDARTLFADEDAAEESAEGRKGKAQRDAGSGSVELDLEPKAQAEGLFRLTGARAGIDGVYRMVSVTHRATRSGGATTSVTLKHPSAGAGRDKRRAVSEDDNHQEEL